MLRASDPPISAISATPIPIAGIAASSVVCERYPEKCSRAVTSTTPSVQTTIPTISAGAAPDARPTSAPRPPTKIAISETGTPPNRLGGRSP